MPESHTGEAGKAKRRWELLRRLMLQGERYTKEFVDISTRPLTELKLFSKQCVGQVTQQNEDIKVIKYNLKGKGLTLKLNDTFSGVSLSKLRTDANEADRTGMLCIWPSEEALAYWCMNVPEIFDGKNVIELGSGMGLCGLVIACCTNAKTVVLTDGNSETVTRLSENISANSALFGNTVVDATNLYWSDAGLESWRTSMSPSSKIKYDWIVCADCVYDAKIYTLLSDMIRNLIQPDANDEETSTSTCECLLMCPDRGNGHKDFIQVACKSGLKVKEHWHLPKELSDCYTSHIEAGDFKEKELPHLLKLSM